VIISLNLTKFNGNPACDLEIEVNFLCAFQKEICRKTHYFPDAHPSRLMLETMHTTGVLAQNPFQAHCIKIRPENSVQF
jgi:hypothetical protein